MNPAFNRTPKFIMYHLFCVDAALRPAEQSLEQIDKSNLCLSADPAVARRCLHLNHATPAATIVADLQEMGITGLACVGLDGTSIAPDEIRSPRYRELIQQVHQAGLTFVHGFPFADTYDNRLTTKFPYIKQKTHDGRYPYVGWDVVNGHPNVDYGSEEFVAFCKECIDALAELGVKAIDYAEPDQYPWDDNGYGESLGKAWSKATGQPLPHPTTVAHRVFMEDRNQHGLRAISDYAHAKGMIDHLTESPLIHGSALVCQNFGKLSRTQISQLSTTFHPHYTHVVANLLEQQAQLIVQPNRTLGLGCIESKSMRGWGERHGIYCGCGQGLPPQRIEDALSAYILLHQMDVCFWDYGNFRNQSMYSYNQFEDPAAKYRFFKKTVRDIIDTYDALPDAYRHAVTAPDALIVYAKQSDYARLVDPDPTKMTGWAGLYAVACKLQSVDLAAMFAFDEYPEVFERDGRDVSLLLVDESQEISAAFSVGVAGWFGPGKVLLAGGDLTEQTLQLLRKLTDPHPNPLPQTARERGSEIRVASASNPRAVKFESSDIGRPRGADYACATALIDTSNWQPLRTFNNQPIVFVRGDAATGLLIYSSVPLARLSQTDLGSLCDFALQQVDAARVTCSGDMPREIVRYKNGDRTFVAIKNYGAELSILSLQTPTKPRGVFPHDRDVAHHEKEGNWITALSFKPFEVRIISL